MSDLHPICSMLADLALPWPHRFGMLRDLVNNVKLETESIVKSILDSFGKQSAETVYQEKVRKLDGLLKEMQQGRMRSATVIEMLPQNGGAGPLALVLLDDRTGAYTVVPKEESLPALLYQVAMRCQRHEQEPRRPAALPGAAQLLPLPPARGPPFVLDLHPTPQAHTGHARSGLGQAHDRRS